MPQQIDVFVQNGLKMRVARVDQHALRVAPIVIRQLPPRDPKSMVPDDLLYVRPVEVAPHGSET